MTSTQFARTAAVVTLLLTTAHAARAQRCMGLPSVSGTAGNFSTIADAYGSERSILGRAGVVTSRVFGGVQGGYVGVKVQDPSRGIFGADLGLSFKVGNFPKPLDVCPFAQALARIDTWETSERRTHAMFGLAVGQELRLGSRFALVPFVDGALVRSAYTYEVLVATPNGFREAPKRSTELGGRYGAGFGLRAADVLTVRPAFHFVSGFRNVVGNANQPGATVSLIYSFGHR